MEFSLTRRLMAEALGTMLLVTAVVGSGIMAERLTQDIALALLCNTIPTGAVLYVLIAVLGPVSGAHFNPAVTLAFLMQGTIGPRAGAAYVLVQVLAGIAGTVLAHAMFEMPLIQLSLTVRVGPAQWLAEVVAAFGLVFAILAGVRLRPDAVPMLVGFYITAAYWFTASTSFANPAVAIARGFTDTFSGIRPGDVPGFVIAELFGAIAAVAFVRLLLGRPRD